YISGSNAFQILIARCLAAQTLMKNNDPSGCMWEMHWAGPGQGAVNTFPSSQSSWNAAHYRGARVQAGVCLGLQWCVGMSLEGSVGVVYFDELDAGDNTPGWLGAARNAPFFNSNGTYRPPNATASSLFSSNGVMTFTYQ